jgi:enamine deaminase RidA (YjgF/YER057c/UK114 family)
MPTAINPPGFPPNPLVSPGTLVETAGRTLYVSGQVGVGPDGQPAEGLAAQTMAALVNLNAVLEAAGMSAANIVKLTIFLTDEANIPAFIETAAAALPSPAPATTLLVVKALAAPPLLVEIEAIASS